jgi:hypothetical protein
MSSVQYISTTSLSTLAVPSLIIEGRSERSYKNSKRLAYRLISISTTSRLRALSTSALSSRQGRASMSTLKRLKR